MQSDSDAEEHMLIQDQPSELKILIPHPLFLASEKCRSQIIFTQENYKQRKSNDLGAKIVTMGMKYCSLRAVVKMLISLHVKEKRKTGAPPCDCH